MVGNAPLPAMLGGALRRRVVTAITVPLDAGNVPTGVRRAVLTSSERDVTALMVSVDAAATALGPVCELALRLDGQLDPAALEPLREQGRRLRFGYIADPCVDLDQACAAFAQGAPPLAVSVDRYPQSDLARVMRDGGVQVLLVDPVLAGGPQAARMWSVAALAAEAADDAPRTMTAGMPRSTRRGLHQPCAPPPSPWSWDPAKPMCRSIFRSSLRHPLGSPASPCTA